jgi:hypothetical protein
LAIVELLRTGVENQFCQGKFVKKYHLLACPNDTSITPLFVKLNPLFICGYFAVIMQVRWRLILINLQNSRLFCSLQGIA